MTGAGAIRGARLLVLARESTLVLGLTLFLPFMVHLLPSWDDSPLGSHLLPIFYAPLGALFLGRTGIALVVSVIAPWVNHFLTGHPVVPMAILLCLQLGIFAPVCAWFHRRGLAAILIGPAGYLTALVLTAILGTLMKAAGLAIPIYLAAVPRNILNSLPGMAILALIGFWFSRQRPRGA